MTTFEETKWAGLLSIFKSINNDVLVGDAVFSDTVCSRHTTEPRASKRFHVDAIHTDPISDNELYIPAYYIGSYGNSQFADYIVPAYKIVNQLYNGHDIIRVSNSGDSVVRFEYFNEAHELNIIEEKRGNWGLNLAPLAEDELDNWPLFKITALDD